MNTLPRIDSYQFGRMTISGHAYTNDLIIYPSGRIKDGWFRKNGHLLLPNDIKTILETSPDLLIIGQGASGRMSVEAAVLDLLKKRGIRTIINPTGIVVDKYNEMIRTDCKLAACFHLTC